MRGIPDWLDERIHLDEIPGHMFDAAKTRRDTSDFAATQAGLTKSDQDILASIPPDRFASEVHRRFQVRQAMKARARVGRAPSKATWGTLALAGLAGLFFLLPTSQILHRSPVQTPNWDSASSALPDPAPDPGLPPIPPVQTNSGSAGQPFAGPTAPDWRSKGAPMLHLQQMMGNILVPVTDADTVLAGSILRLSVPDSLPWAAIFSIDSRGEMAQHWPMQGDSASPLRQGLLPRSWELDDSPGKETFVLVWSSRQFSLHQVRKAIFLNRVHPKIGPQMQLSVVQVARPIAARP